MPQKIIDEIIKETYMAPSSANGLPQRFINIVAPLILGYSKGIPNQPERIEPQILKIVS